MPSVTRPRFPSDEQLLFDALHDDPVAWRRLVVRFEPFLRSIARRRLGDLSPETHKDFQQEIWMRVAACKPSAFDCAQESVKSFVNRFVSAAINSVRAMYRPPGVRSRDRKPHDAVIPLSEIDPLRDDRADRAFRRVEARIDLTRVLSVAREREMQGLALMLDEDISTTAAARRIGMPRETFRRRMIALPSLLRSMRNSGRVSRSSAVDRTN